MDLLLKLLGLIRFSHTLFALPFAILGGAMALKLNWYENPEYCPRMIEWVGILLCMVFARSAAMGFNRWADNELDAQNPRTANRHLPAGLLTVRSVLFFVVVCSVGFIASTLLFLPNRIPFFFSVPVLFFLFCYSYAKRWTIAAHFWLGGALMLAPLAAWIVIRPVLLPIPLPPVLLALAVLFWTAGFDLIYATQDTEFDKK
ncbi:MAG: UbiA family prenyltransferase, partial [Planctomycetaceae bacterium]|nr:UbiA family prenyltransferase [Planctomycetaceae bacterium]